MESKGGIVVDLDRFSRPIYGEGSITKLDHDQRLFLRKESARDKVREFIHHFQDEHMQMPCNEIILEEPTLLGYDMIDDELINDIKEHMR